VKHTNRKDADIGFEDRGWRIANFTQAELSILDLLSSILGPFSGLTAD